VLGRALRALPRDQARCKSQRVRPLKRAQFILSTKVGRYGQSDFDYSAARVTRSVEESMARLGVTYVDVVQCHDVEFVPLDQVVREALPGAAEVTRVRSPLHAHALAALAALKAAGKVGFVGITGLPLAHLQRVLSAAPPGSVDVVLSYCKLSLADSTLLGAAGALRGPGGRGLISASPLCMGLLTAAGPPTWHPAPQSLRTAAAAASAACEAAGRLIAPLALQWAVRRSEVDCTLVGMSTVAQVTANCESVRAALQPGWEAEAAAALAAAQACLAPNVDMDWPSGLPENE